MRALSKEEKEYREFENALAHFIQEEMPWPYEDADRYSDEANDAAWAIAKSVGPSLWGDMCRGVVR
jgi:hypothetical protein